MTRTLACAFATVLLACGSSGDGSCDPSAQTGCGAGLACELVQGSSPACFAPVLVRGTVADIVTAALLNGARVVALDATGLRSRRFRSR